METEVFSMPYVKIQVHATNSLIKSSLEFCSTHDLQLKHGISILVPGQGDKALMLLFYENNILMKKNYLLIDATYSSRHITYQIFLMGQAHISLMTLG